MLRQDIDAVSDAIDLPWSNGQAESKGNGTYVLKEILKNALIVSCQHVPGGAMDDSQYVVGFGLAALSAGAAGLRIESARYVAAVRAATDAPIIGLIKRDLDDSPVRITPFLHDVKALADAGADIIAFDATDRVRPVTLRSAGQGRPGSRQALDGRLQLRRGRSAGARRWRRLRWDDDVWLYRRPGAR